MSEKDKIITNFKGNLIDYIDKLQQENQQLKAKLEMYENGVYYSSENDKLQAINESLNSLVNSCQTEIRKYKEVIEEIREYIEKSSLEVSTREYGMLTVCDSDNILQILDKVGETDE